MSGRTKGVLLTARIDISINYRRSEMVSQVTHKRMLLKCLRRLPTRKPQNRKREKEPRIPLADEEIEAKSTIKCSVYNRFSRPFGIWETPSSFPQSFHHAFETLQAREANPK